MVVMGELSLEAGVCCCTSLGLWLCEGVLLLWPDVGVGEGRRPGSGESRSHPRQVGTRQKSDETRADYG